MNSILTKSYVAGAAIAACRFLKHGAADGAAIQATDGASPLLGVSEQLGVDSGGLVDAIKDGIALIELGDTVTRGAWLMPDANGKAIPAVIVAGTALYVGGQAEVAGVAGDIIAMHVMPAVIGNDTAIVQTDITVSAAEMKALNAVPKQLVAAPGAGKILILEDAQFFLDWGAAAYAGIAAGEDMAICYTNGAGVQVAVVETTGFLDAVADSYRTVRPLADAAKTPAVNAALVLAMLVGEIITGDSPLKLRIRYRSVDAAF